SRRYRPLGEVKEVESDFRLVCASNRDLKAMVRQGDFREDLFYRIRTFTLELPPLREHMEDLPELVEHHLAAITSKSGLPAKVLSPELEKLLYGYDWPGNVRELVNVLEVLVASAPTDDVLLPIYLPRELRVHFFRSRVVGGGKAADQSAPGGSGKVCLNWAEFRKKGVKALERRFLEDLIRASNGELKKAMDLSGLSQARIYGMLKGHGLNLRERAKRARDMN
ncbi:MAG: sigma 54-interacting transcriptional regulator, partial [Desulfovibrionaceae bacterium]|nr:sigma 54-interacting transcriptional regulator [Desulfovibrionaceae bacterium]